MERNWEMVDAEVSACGPATYQLIRNLVSPAKPTDKTFAELVSLVQEHQQPTPSFIVQRYHFNTRVQRQGESISEFIAQLRKLSEYCHYGESLDDMLRDRLVWAMMPGQTPAVQTPGRP